VDDGSAEGAGAGGEERAGGEGGDRGHAPKIEGIDCARRRLRRTDSPVANAGFF
jgi:hypothetical protein